MGLAGQLVKPPLALMKTESPEERKAIIMFAVIVLPCLTQPSSNQTV